MVQTQEKEYWTERAYVLRGQLENWNNLLDMANAIRYGFAQYRLPKPGQAIDVVEAKERAEHIEKRWEIEGTGRRDDSVEEKSPAFAQLPIEAQCYLASVLSRAEPKNKPQSENPLLNEYYD